MKKRNKILLGIASLVVLISLFLAFAFVSLYGENGKVDEAVIAFFDDLKNKNYGAICAGLPEYANTPSLSADDKCSDAMFLLETTLLEQYKLLGSESYTVETKKDHFWIPFLERYRKPVRVSVVLREEKKSTHSKASTTKKISDAAKGILTVVPRGDLPFVEHLLTVKRSHGVWTVVRITPEDSDIASLYAGLKERIAFGRYVRKTERGVMIERTEIDTGTMTPLDRRVLGYNLRKIQDLINKK